MDEEDVITSLEEKEDSSFLQLVSGDNIDSARLEMNDDYKEMLQAVSAACGKSQEGAIVNMSGDNLSYDGSDSSSSSSSCSSGCCSSESSDRSNITFCHDERDITVNEQKCERQEDCGGDSEEGIIHEDKQENVVVVVEEEKSASVGCYNPCDDLPTTSNECESQGHRQRMMNDERRAMSDNVSWGEETKRKRYVRRQIIKKPYKRSSRSDSAPSRYDISATVSPPRYDLGTYSTPPRYSDRGGRLSRELSLCKKPLPRLVMRGEYDVDINLGKSPFSPCIPHERIKPNLHLLKGQRILVNPTNYRRGVSLIYAYIHEVRPTYATGDEWRERSPSNTRPRRRYRSPERAEESPPRTLPHRRYRSPERAEESPPRTIPHRRYRSPERAEERSAVYNRFTITSTRQSAREITTAPRSRALPLEMYRRFEPERSPHFRYEGERGLANRHLYNEAERNLDYERFMNNYYGYFHYIPSLHHPR